MAKRRPRQTNLPRSTLASAWAVPSQNLLPAFQQKWSEPIGTDNGVAGVVADDGEYKGHTCLNWYIEQEPPRSRSVSTEGTRAVRLTPDTGTQEQRITTTDRHRHERYQDNRMLLLEGRCHIYFHDRRHLPTRPAPLPSSLHSEHSAPSVKVVAANTAQLDRPNASKRDSLQWKSFLGLYLTGRESAGWQRHCLSHLIEPTPWRLQTSFPKRYMSTGTKWTRQEEPSRFRLKETWPGKEEDTHIGTWPENTHGGWRWHRSYSITQSPRLSAQHAQAKVLVVVETRGAYHAPNPESSIRRVV